MYKLYACTQVSLVGRIPVEIEGKGDGIALPPLLIQWHQFDRGVLLVAVGSRISLHCDDQMRRLEFSDENADWTPIASLDLAEPGGLSPSLRIEAVGWTSEVVEGRPTVVASTSVGVLVLECHKWRTDKRYRNSIVGRVREQNQRLQCVVGERAHLGWDCSLFRVLGEYRAKCQRLSAFHPDRLIEYLRDGRGAAVRVCIYVYSNRHIRVNME